MVSPVLWDFFLRGWPSVKPMVTHQYGFGPRCIYCDAPRIEASTPCAVATEVEAHWLVWGLGGEYDPERHLQVLVAALRHRTRKELTVEFLAHGPGVTFVVRRETEIIAEASSTIRQMAAREAGAQLWRWQSGRQGVPN